MTKRYLEAANQSVQRFKDMVTCLGAAHFAVRVVSESAARGCFLSQEAKTREELTAAAGA